MAVKRSDGYFNRDGADAHFWPPYSRRKAVGSTAEAPAVQGEALNQMQSKGWGWHGTGRQTGTESDIVPPGSAPRRRADHAQQGLLLVLHRPARLQRAFRTDEP